MRDARLQRSTRGPRSPLLVYPEIRARELAEEAPTVGRYLAQIRAVLSDNNARVQALIPVEQYRLWTVVVAGNDPEGDVAALTRGGYAYADIDRLLTATEGNIVKELDRVTVLSVARQYGDGHLHQLMQDAGMSTSEDPKAKDRLLASELGLDLGTDLSIASDVYCLKGGEPIRLEIMWRSSTSRAQLID